jgi:hypothetical protein
MTLNRPITIPRPDIALLVFDMAPPGIPASLERRDRLYLKDYEEISGFVPGLNS